MDAAREAAQRLNGYNLEGGVLRVDRLMDRRRGPRGAMGGGAMGGRMGVPGATSPSQRHTDFPLRILVLSEMVGAIIGRQGATIRTITQQVSLNFVVCLYIAFFLLLASLFLVMLQSTCKPSPVFVLIILLVIKLSVLLNVKNHKVFRMHQQLRPFTVTLMWHLIIPPESCFMVMNMVHYM